MENPFQILLDRLDQIEQRVIELQRLVEKKAATPPDELMTIQQVADYLKLTVNTLYGYTSKNKIPHIKKGKRIYFLKKDIDAWLLQSRRKTNEEIQNEVQEYLVSSRRRK